MQEEADVQPETTEKKPKLEKVTAGWNGEEEKLELENGDGCFSRWLGLKGGWGNKLKPRKEKESLSFQFKKKMVTVRKKMMNGEEMKL